MPAANPVTTPPPSVTLAIAGVLLAQVPDGVVCDKVVILPIHTSAVPVMAAGAGVTVTTLVEVQPALSE